MRILLDESVPRQLGPLLKGHSVSTVPREGWAGLKNGKLMKKASSDFDAFITGDQNLEFQQEYSELDLGIVVLVAPNNRVETIAALAKPVLTALSDLRAGQVVHVAA